MAILFNDLLESLAATARSSLTPPSFRRRSDGQRILGQHRQNAVWKRSARSFVMGDPLRSLCGRILTRTAMRHLPPRLRARKRSGDAGFATTITPKRFPRPDPHLDLREAALGLSMPPAVTPNRFLSWKHRRAPEKLVPLSADASQSSHARTTAGIYRTRPSAACTSACRQHEDRDGIRNSKHRERRSGSRP